MIIQITEDVTGYLEIQLYPVAESGIGVAVPTILVLDLSSAENLLIQENEVEVCEKK